VSSSCSPLTTLLRAWIDVDVLKCEVWKRSCARLVLGDQLLSFTLVPLAAVAAAEGARLARDLELSSTDLLHSPVGTVRLSLALHSGHVPPGVACPSPPEDDKNKTGSLVRCVSYRVCFVSNLLHYVCAIDPAYRGMVVELTSWARRVRVQGSRRVRVAA
jgi:hypothetical protein